MSEVEREDYDWTNAARDIALMTRLTLNDASRLTIQLGYTDLVPYDAVPRLVELINATTGEGIGEALRVLLTGDERALWEIHAERNPG